MNNIIKEVSSVYILHFYVYGWSTLNFSTSAHDMDLLKESMRIFGEFKIPMWLETIQI